MLYTVDMDYLLDSFRRLADVPSPVGFYPLMNPVLEEMAREKNDLHCYIDLFGTHPKYGINGRKISSITYKPQPYQRTIPLYER